MYKIPPPLFDLLHTQSLLIVSDYDGTLAPFTTNPDNALPDPLAWKAFLSLAELPNVQIALLTGRNRNNILQLTNFPFPALTVGAHGADLPDTKITLSASELELYEKLSTQLKNLSKDISCAFIEEKPLSVVLHIRQCPPELGNSLIESAIQLSNSFLGVHPTLGNKIAEFSIRSTHKGDGLAWLIEHVNPTGTIFLGDDRTDENGFRWLKQNRPQDSFSLKVGPGETLADDRVHNIDAIADFFLAIYRIRAEIR